MSADGHPDHEIVWQPSTHSGCASVAIDCLAAVVRLQWIGACFTRTGLYPALGSSLLTLRRVQVCRASSVLQILMSAMVGLYSDSAFSPLKLLNGVPRDRQILTTLRY